MSKKGKKGVFYDKIKGCRTHAYVSSENFDVTAVVYVRAIKKDYLIEMLNEAKTEAYCEEPTSDWCAQDFMDNYNSLRHWVIKWFGDKR